MSGHPPGLVPANIVIKPQGQTRTLAQIKAQTQAARAQSGTTSPHHPGSSPSLTAPAMRSLLTSPATAPQPGIPTLKVSHHVSIGKSSVKIFFFFLCYFMLACLI
jgi:hypothetical protein